MPAIRKTQRANCITLTPSADEMGFATGRSTSLLRAAFGIFPLPMFLHSRLDDSANQPVRDRLIKWKLEIPFRPAIGRDILHQFFVARHRRKKADVTVESREVDENAILKERRHSVADLLRRLWGGLSNGRPDLFQDRSD